MDGNEHVYATPEIELEADQKGTDMRERKYGGEFFRGGTLADMLWVENFVLQNGYEAWAQLRDEVGEDHRRREDYRAARDAEHAAFEAENPELIAQWENEGPCAWDGDHHADGGVNMGAAGYARDPQQATRDAAWDTAVGVAYREVVLDYGNDGRPEDDRHLTDEERTRRADAVSEISQATGLPEGDVRREVPDEAWAHGQSDDYSTHLQAPDWGQLIEAHRQDSYDEAFDDIYQDRVGDYEVALGTEAQKIYNQQFDHDYYGGIIGDGQAEDSYSDQLWAHAEGVAAGRLAERGIYHPDDWDEIVDEAYEANAQLDRTLTEAHELDAEIDQLDAQAGQLRQDLADGHVRAADEHDIQQLLEWTEEQLALAKGATVDDVYRPSPTGPAPAETHLTEDQVSEMATSWPETPGEGEPDPDEIYRGDPGDEAAMTEAEFMAQSQNPEDRPAGDSTAADMAASDRVLAGPWASYYERLAQTGVGPVPRETDQAIARDLVDQHPELVDVAESLSDSELLGAFLEVDPGDPVALAAAIADAEAAVQDLINGPRLEGGDADSSAQEHELELKGDPAADVGYLDAPTDDADTDAESADNADPSPRGSEPAETLSGSPTDDSEIYAVYDTIRDRDHYASLGGDSTAEGKYVEQCWETARAVVLEERWRAEALLSELLTDLDNTEPDSYPGDNSAYWDADNTGVAGALPQGHDIDTATGRALAPDLNSDYTDAAEDAFFANEPAPAGYASAVVKAPRLEAEPARQADAADAVARAHQAVTRSITPAAEDNGGNREGPTEWERLLISTQPDSFAHDELFDTLEVANRDTDEPGDQPPGNADVADAVARAHQAVAELRNRETAERSEPVTQQAATTDAGEVAGDE